MNPTPPQRPPAVRELAEALRLTREYVGEELLPPVDGWSWYDALRRWAPEHLPPETPITTSRAPEVACTTLHTNGRGNTIPCPGWPHAEPPDPDPHPALTAKLSRASSESRLRDAEIRAAVAERDAKAYHNQVQALVREILRMREVPEEELPTRVSVIILNEEAP